jgi:ADP-ribose pyrophosphatase
MKKVIAQGRYIRFVKDGKWEYFERHNCQGIVIIVALTDERKVLFVEQYRPPVKKNVIEFPAGLVSDQKKFKNESIAVAAKRELFEETGYRARKMSKLLHGPVSGGASSDMVTMMLASGLQKTGSGGGDHTEMITVHEVPISKVEGWLKTQERKGLLIEPKIYSGLYFLNKYNKVS